MQDNFEHLMQQQQLTSRDGKDRSIPLWANNTGTRPMHNAGDRDDGSRRRMDMLDTTTSAVYGGDGDTMNGSLTYR